MVVDNWLPSKDNFPYQLLVCIFLNEDSVLEKP